MTRLRFSWPLAFVLIALIGAILVYFIFDRITSWPERAFASFTHESAASVAKLRDVLADSFQLRPRIVVKDKVFSESSQEVMQLTVLTKETQVTHESDQSWLGSTKHIRIRATFRLHAGFDLDKECQVAVKGTTVTVTFAAGEDPQHRSSPLGGRTTPGRSLEPDSTRGRRRRA